MNNPFFSNLGLYVLGNDQQIYGSCHEGGPVLLPCFDVLVAKSGNTTGAPLWPDPYNHVQLLQHGPIWYDVAYSTALFCAERKFEFTKSHILFSRVSYDTLFRFHGSQWCYETCGYHKSGIYVHKLGQKPHLLYVFYWFILCVTHMHSFTQTCPRNITAMIIFLYQNWTIKCIVKYHFLF